ncbi:hypothetical protein C8Q75DRAFT_485651 [Abortiporus biennis]|nr:hypothetical protein C8Q75DRAFT_485651 [Abortiporus biennis]
MTVTCSPQDAASGVAFFKSVCGAIKYDFGLLSVKVIMIASWYISLNEHPSRATFFITNGYEMCSKFRHLFSSLYCGLLLIFFLLEASCILRGCFIMVHIQGSSRCWGLDIWYTLYTSIYRDAPGIFFLHSRSFRW